MRPLRLQGRRVRSREEGWLRTELLQRTQEGKKRGGGASAVPLHPLTKPSEHCRGHRCVSGWGSLLHTNDTCGKVRLATPVGPQGLICIMKLEQLLL